MERQWLREQVGGRIASQDRLRAERSALSLMRSTARARGAAEHAAPASSTAASSGWKAWKRSALSSAASKRKSKRKKGLRSVPHPASRFSVASSFLRALLGGSGRSAISASSTLPADQPASDRQNGSSLRRCPRCGKTIKRRTANVAARPDHMHAQMLPQEKRANADQLLSAPLLPSVAATSPLVYDAHPGTNPTPSHRPHPLSTLDTSRPGPSDRTLPSTYTHVCRRKSKSSNEWHNIKFMVRTASSLLLHRLCH